MFVRRKLYSHRCFYQVNSQIRPELRDFYATYYLRRAGAGGGSIFLWGYCVAERLTLALEGVCFVFCFLLGENLYCGVEYTRT